MQPAGTLKTHDIKAPLHEQQDSGLLSSLPPLSDNIQLFIHSLTHLSIHSFIHSTSTTAHY